MPQGTAVAQEGSPYTTAAAVAHSVVQFGAPHLHRRVVVPSCCCISTVVYVHTLNPHPRSNINILPDGPHAVVD